MKILPKVILGALMVVTGATGQVRAQADGVSESPDGPEAVKVYYTQAEALEKAFAGADSTWVETWQPSSAELALLEARLGWQVPTGPVEIHRGRRGRQDLGYAVITEENGRFKPITFLVKVGPEGRVSLVLVMVYRESRGDGVKRQRFLKQFQRKDAASPLRLNRDIVGVSGATLSSRGVTAGVKRVLAMVEVRYGAGGGR
jgi:hypothetical protein